MFNSYIPETGKPRRVLADHGTQFMSPVLIDALRGSDIKAIFYSIRHPQSNPTERVMRELGRLFRTLCSDKHTKWALCASDIKYFLNITTHFSAGFTRLELHFSHKPTDLIKSLICYPKVDHISQDAKIILARERINKNFEKRRRAQKTYSRIVLRTGDHVLLRAPKQSNKLDKGTHKFFHIFFGPYQIIEDLGNNSYKLADIHKADKIVGIYNQSNLKEYIGDPMA